MMEADGALSLSFEEPYVSASQSYVNPDELVYWDFNARTEPRVTGVITEEAFAAWLRRLPTKSASQIRREEMAKKRVPVAPRTPPPPPEPGKDPDMDLLLMRLEERYKDEAMTSGRPSWMRYATLEPESSYPPRRRLGSPSRNFPQTTPGASSLALSGHETPVRPPPPVRPSQPKPLQSTQIQPRKPQKTQPPKPQQPLVIREFKLRPPSLEKFLATQASSSSSTGNSNWSPKSAIPPTKPVLSSAASSTNQHNMIMNGRSLNRPTQSPLGSSTAPAGTSMNSLNLPRHSAIVQSARPSSFSTPASSSTFRSFASSTGNQAANRPCSEQPSASQVSRTFNSWCASSASTTAASSHSVSLRDARPAPAAGTQPPRPKWNPYATAASGNISTVVNNSSTMRNRSNSSSSSRSQQTPSAFSYSQKGHFSNSSKVRTSVSLPQANQAHVPIKTYSFDILRQRLEAKKRRSSLNKSFSSDDLPEVEDEVQPTLKPSSDGGLCKATLSVNQSPLAPVSATTGSMNPPDGKKPRYSLHTIQDQRISCLPAPILIRPPGYTGTSSEVDMKIAAMTARISPAKSQSPGKPLSQTGLGPTSKPVSRLFPEPTRNSLGNSNTTSGTSSCNTSHNSSKGSVGSSSYSFGTHGGIASSVVSGKQTASNVTIGSNAHCTPKSARWSLNTSERNANDSGLAPGSSVVKDSSVEDDFSDLYDDEEDDLTQPLPREDPANAAAIDEEELRLLTQYCLEDGEF